MNDQSLLPSMFQADWREDRQPWRVVALDAWPVDTPLAPLPPVPVLAIGSPMHPQAGRADVIVGNGISLDQIVAGISRTPNAAAVLVQLLRAIEALSPADALPLESMAFATLQAGAEHRAWQAGRRGPTLSAPGTLHLARTDDRLDLVIDRPAARNAIDRDMRDALHDAFTLAALDPSIARVRLTATGRCFSIGADLAEFGTTRDPVAAHAIRMATLPALPLSRRTATFEAHIDGGCIGSGLEIAAFADRVTATRNAWFQLPEVAMGILPGFGGCVSIPRRIGRQRAAALMLSGKRIGVETALRWGLVDHVVEEAPAHR